MRNTRPTDRRWYMARCILCEMTLPFSKKEDRDGWTDIHASAPHSSAETEGDVEVEVWEEPR